MKKTWKRLMALLCVSVMVLSGFSAMAAESTNSTTKFDVSGSKTAKPVELACPDRKTTVTLSLPSAEYKNKIDIVFAMDSSSSAEAGTAFTEAVNDLFDSILENNTNLTMKVGVIVFRGRAYDAVDIKSNGAYKKLVEYNDDTKDFITNALKMTTEEIEKLGNCSNTHAGMVIADEWLTEDEEVAPDHKYVVLCTDGKSYVWYNEKNEPTTIYSQYYKWTRGVGANVMQNGGLPNVAQNAGYNKYGNALDVNDPTGNSNVFAFSAADFEDLINSTNEELTGVTKWDQFCYRADDVNDIPAGTAIKHETTNGETVFNGKQDAQYYYEYIPSGHWEGVPYLEANPYAVIKNEDGTYTFDTKTINPNYYQYHVDCLQKGVYIAAHKWLEMLDKYNCAAVTFLNHKDPAVSNVAVPFNAWLRENSKFSAEANNAAAIKEMFTGIDNSIRYMVASGVVTDVIADPFTLVASEGVCPFILTVNGEEFPGVQGTSENTWDYNKEGKTYYSVSYDETAKTITWTINVPIENSKPITLSYDLELSEDAETGKYPTNKSAVLNYKSSDGTKDGTFTFEVPEVTYIACTSVTVQKVWNDDNDAAKARPEEVEVVLKDGDGNTWSLVLDERSQWTGTFDHEGGKHIPDSKLVNGQLVAIEYTVEEVEVENYEVACTGSAKDGFTITNTYVPPTTEAETTEAATTEAATTEAETTAPETTEEQTTPPTGDNMNILPFAAIFVLAAAAFVVLSRTKARDER